MASMMVTASDELMARLEQVAEERGVSLEDVILDALEAKARQSPPLPRSLGFGASGHSDTAQVAGEQRAIPRSWR